MTGRLADALTAVAARAYPRSGCTDARVVRDCAREAIAANGLHTLVRESASLVTAGLRARVGVAALELSRAPWRAALGALTLPLATALLLVWTFGFVPRYDHWPLGEGWVLLLGGSLTAMVGAALRSRWLTAGGAAATFIAAAAPYLGFGTEMALAQTPSFFHGWSVDFGAASLLPALLLVAGGLSLPRGPRPPVRAVLARLAAGLIPAAIAAVALLPYATPKPTIAFLYAGPDSAPIVQEGPPYPMPWLPPSRGLLAILGIALAIAVIVTWREFRAHPERALATGLVLASVAYPLTWVATRTEALNAPYWLLNGPYPLLLAALPALLALALMRRAGRKQPT
ncbi:MAG: hypothetical protein QOH58_1607 [Thermoleophilaceae bacterium]|jgi:hypothetical protein|nr:hypothetical protein [Thermoleophilaceae bacterium]